jgi:hypothetical protein
MYSLVTKDFYVVILDSKTEGNGVRVGLINYVLLPLCTCINEGKKSVRDSP